MWFYFLVSLQLPMLHRYLLTIRHQTEKKQREISRKSWQHCNLKEVTIFNFQGNNMEVELVEYLINHTVALEKIKLDRKPLTYVGDGKWVDPWWKEDYISRERVFRMLHKKIPADTNLIVK